MKSSVRTVALVCVAAVVLLASPAWAVVMGQTQDFVGQWSGENWSLDATHVYGWNGSSAVAVGDYYLLTARHVGGGVGQSIDIDGQSYHVVSIEDAPALDGSLPPDLRLLRVDRKLPGYHQIYDGAFHGGQDVIMIGMGVTGGGQGDLFYPGDGRGIRRWGTNEIDALLSLGESSGTMQSIAFQMDFQQGQTLYESGLGVGDSGGGVFVRDGDRWMLAGISAYARGAGAGAYDASFAVALPYYQDWLTSATAIVVPEPASLMLLLAGGCGMLSARAIRRRPWGVN